MCSLERICFTCEFTIYLHIFTGIYLLGLNIQFTHLCWTFTGIQQLQFIHPSSGSLPPIWFNLAWEFTKTHPVILEHMVVTLVFNLPTFTVRWDVVWFFESPYCSSCVLIKKLYPDPISIRCSRGSLPEFYFFLQKESTSKRQNHV